MHADNRTLIKFNDFHLPFSEKDIIAILAQKKIPKILKHKFPAGEGMSDILNEEKLDLLVEHSQTIENEDEAAIKLDTLIIANKWVPIRGEDIYRIIQEAKDKVVTVASLVHKLPIKNTSTKIYVSPNPGVTEQAHRTGSRKKDV